MEKITYILGAGFSQPLGLPVIGNFLEKSKDLYAEDNNKYRSFKPIYNIIKEIAFLKNYINSDQNNIEEILSILEMGNFVGRYSKELSAYKDFIKKVVKAYTPEIKIDPEKEVGITRPNRNYFGINNIHNRFGYFIADLFQINICETNDFKDFDKNIRLELREKNNYEYNIITLNYDTVIENYVNYINKYYISKSEEKLNIINYYNNINCRGLKYCKLHGCVNKDIVLPTWNKNDAEKIKDQWKIAYELLKDSNQIRIIGYSIPVNDNYIRYLLSISLKDANHLKKVDIITLDNDNETKMRFENIFILKNFRFKNGNFINFLNGLYGKHSFKVIKNNILKIEFSSDILESEHDLFMEKQ